MHEDLELSTSSNRPIVWSIAASDSGGGAGIQADLQTINDLSCHACTVITGVTAQNSVAVDLVEPVTQYMLKQQLDTLSTDLPPVAIKIGLLVDQHQIDLLGHWLSKSKEVNPNVQVVLDPVLVATCGDSLNDDLGVNFSPFKGVINLLTPNYSELHQLTAHCKNASIKERARFLANQLDCSVLAKGGDNPNDELYAEDILICRNVGHCSELHQNETIRFVNKRIKSDNTHGTGCTLSSAIASFIAHGYPLQDAVLQANAYVHRGIQFSYQIGEGAGPIAKTGWPTDLRHFPRVICEASKLLINDTAKPFRSMIGDIGVYPVVDSAEMISSLLSAGCKTVQLRIKEDLVEKNGPDWLEQQVAKVIELGYQHKAQVFINDHWQLAIKHNAFGVHLGQEDVFQADLNLIKSSGLALGLSSHGVFEALLAQQLKPSYVAIGHIYPTPTKDMPSIPQGISKVKRQVSLLSSDIPLVAIGGISAAQFNIIKQIGVNGVAVVRAVTLADKPAQAFNVLTNLWEQSSWQEAV
ncbi:thiamine-phosphate pyrophosphorylase [Shewanella sp. OPT22]|nr:thiamine-phosphate pyrophosphorylase [Shewanella sp. OPT22]